MYVYSPLLLLSYAPFVLSLSRQRRIRVLLGDIAHRRRAGRPVIKTHSAGSWGSNDPDVELNRVFFPVCVFLFCYKEKRTLDNSYSRKRVGSHIWLACVCCLFLVCRAPLIIASFYLFFCCMTSAYEILIVETIFLFNMYNVTGIPRIRIFDRHCVGIFGPDNLMLPLAAEG